jgi:hypothetical protein
MKQPTAEVGMVDRADDVSYVMDCAASADCCSIVGVSNIGKSMLLRSLPDLYEEYLDSAVDSYTFVYVDFNLMSQMTEQGFYEVILRNWLEAVEARRADAGLYSVMRQAYQSVIAPESPFHVPLTFEDSLKAFWDGQSGVLVLLFDEFDDVLAELDPRVFVRLRAMKDRYRSLCYVTATNHRLPQIRTDRQVGEFCELFAPHTRHLAPLNRSDARVLVKRCAEQSDAQLMAQDIDFLLDCADGHPALLQAACRSLDSMQQEMSWRGTAPDYTKLCDRLSGDTDVRLECAKLWNDLSMQEQEVMIRLVAGEDVAFELDTLIEKGIVRTSVAGRQVFGELFAGFVRRQQLVRHREPQGVRVDVEAGDVWVDGELAPTLTDLEYRLLLLLYGNLDKICDKYKIVESVWGESYIDEVDDARIEKLVSRLRQKIEPDPEDPRYLITIRGRGYKLVSLD